jgi:hypothetical protein
VAGVDDLGTKESSKKFEKVKFRGALLNSLERARVGRGQIRQKHKEKKKSHATENS